MNNTVIDFVMQVSLPNHPLNQINKNLHTNGWHQLNDETAWKNLTFQLIWKFVLFLKKNVWKVRKNTIFTTRYMYIQLCWATCGRHEPLNDSVIFFRSNLKIKI